MYVPPSSPSETFTRRFAIPLRVSRPAVTLSFEGHGGCPTDRTGGFTVFDYLRIMLNARLSKMDQRGASAVEYGLLVAGIAALIVAIVFLLGGVLNGVFQTTCDSIANGGGGC
jgi:pilus assembly protein Flp/PilA